MDGKQKNLGVCEKTLQGNFTLNFAPYDNFLSALGSSVVPPLPHPPPPAMLWPKKHSFPPNLLKIQFCLEREGRDR